VDKLDELIRKILGLPSHAIEAAEGIEKVFDDLSIVVPVEYEYGDYHPNQGGGPPTYVPDDALYYARGGIVPQYAARGLFVPKGTDTVPAMLTPGERVLSASDTRQYDAGRGAGMSTTAMEQRLASIESLMRDQPRAIGLAVQDALVLAPRRAA